MSCRKINLSSVSSTRSFRSNLLMLNRVAGIEDQQCSSTGLRAPIPENSIHQSLGPQRPGSELTSNLTSPRIKKSEVQLTLLLRNARFYLQLTAGGRNVVNTMEQKFSVGNFVLPLLPLIWVLMLLVSTLAGEQAPDIASIRQRAEEGSSEAQYQLASHYYMGTGLARDPRQGLTWLQKSAAQGYVAAEHAMGVLFQEGDESVSQNPHEAARWFRKAARQKNTDAQERLSAMLRDGLITEREASWRTPEPPSKVNNKANKDKPAPFSFLEVESGLLGGITSKRMAALVDRFGVDFKLSAPTRQHLVKDGADDNLLTAISASNE